MSKGKRLIPTGDCWCGCGEETKVGSFFRAGHDKKAESLVIEIEFDGSVAQHPRCPRVRARWQEETGVRAGTAGPHARVRGSPTQVLPAGGETPRAAWSNPNRD